MSRAIIVGAFVFGALVLLILAVFLIGNKQFMFAETFELKTEFPDVAGLVAGSEVRIGGLRKGSVKDIRLPDHPSDKVAVVLSVEKDARNLIRSDSVATIDTEGLLGNKYVGISFGTPGAPPVRNGDSIRSAAPTDYSDLIKKADKVITETSEALTEAKNALGTVTRIGQNVENVVQKIDRGEGTIGALVNDRTLYNQASQILDSANQTAQTINSVAEDLSKRTPRIVDEAENAVKDIRQTTSTIASNADPLMQEARQGLGAFNENMQALKRNWFFRGFYRDRGYFDLADLTEHEIADLPQNPDRTYVIKSEDLFDERDTAEIKKEKKLEEIGKSIERSNPGLVVVTAYAGEKGSEEQNLELTRAQAGVVRRFLVDNFRVDEKRILTKGFGETPESGAAGRSPHRVEILVFPPGRGPEAGGEATQ